MKLLIDRRELLKLHLWTISIGALGGVVVALLALPAFHRETLANLVPLLIIVAFSAGTVYCLFGLIHHYLAVALVIVTLLAGSLNSALTWGKHVANDVLKQQAHQTSFPLAQVGLQADDVAIEWGDMPRPPADIPPNLILLGHSDGIFLLSDGRRLLRVHDDRLLMIFCQPHESEDLRRTPPGCGER